MLKESTYPLLPHIRLQACGIGLAQVDQDQAVEDRADHLRIVNDKLWEAAHASITTRRHGIGGRPTRGTVSKYLLTGFARCSVCGGAMVQGWQGFPGYPVYRCWYNQSRGRTVCTNTLTVPMNLADAAILNAVEKDVLGLAPVSWTPRLWGTALGR